MFQIHREDSTVVDYRKDHEFHDDVLLSRANATSDTANDRSRDDAGAGLRHDVRVPNATEQGECDVARNCELRPFMVAESTLVRM